MGKSSMGKLMGLWTRCISAHMEMAATHFCCFPCFLHTAQALDFSKSSPASSILAFSLMHLTPRPHSRRLGLKPGTWDSQSTAPSEPKKKKRKKLSHRSVSCAELSSMSSPISWISSSPKPPIHLDFSQKKLRWEGASVHSQGCWAHPSSHPRVLPHQVAPHGAVLCCHICCQQLSGGRWDVSWLFLSGGRWFSKWLKYCFFSPLLNSFHLLWAKPRLVVASGNHLLSTNTHV